LNEKEGKNMILKNKTIKPASAPTSSAGQKQELDVAFYLRRAFKDNDQIYVINDFKFNHNDETAQIDHLIVYKYGFILIESKSITGEISVNKEGEWSRSYNGKWFGIPSPIKQVELQQKLLGLMLSHNKVQIIGKLLGLVQKDFGGFCWNAVCAVSSNAIIDRNSMGKDVSEQLVKTEFVVDKLKDIMNIKGAMSNFFSNDTRPAFSAQELESITSFLLTKSQDVDEVKYVKQESIGSVKDVKCIGTVVNEDGVLKCKSCGEKSDVTAQHGKFGYFIRCNKCSTNTSMKLPCPKCSNKQTKVTKKKETYTLECSKCESSVRLI
jgi:hypothetical protein